MTQNYSYITRKNDQISLTVSGKNGMESKDCIIFVHGFKGFKDWGFGPYTAEHLANKGFLVIAFNFSHNGIDENGEFTQLDKFAENTFSLELDEVNEIIDAYKKGYFGNSGSNKVGLLGHSRGGGIALLTAAAASQVDCVTTWSSVSNFDRYSERQKKEWRKNGVFEVINSRTKQVMRLNHSLLEDLEQNKNEKLNILKAVENLNKPLLIVHGEQDLAVPVSEAEELYEHSDKSQTEFLRIAGSGHTFDIKHPFEGSNEKFDKVLKTTGNFFSKAFNHSMSLSG